MGAGLPGPRQMYGCCTVTIIHQPSTRLLLAPALRGTLPELSRCGRTWQRLTRRRRRPAAAVVVPGSTKIARTRGSATGPGRPLPAACLALRT